MTVRNRRGAITLDTGTNRRDGISRVLADMSGAANQPFYENTLGWDFHTIWYFDTTVSQYPLLQAFRASNITITPDSGAIGVDDELQLTATVLPAHAQNKNVIWSSSDNSVATVDANGLVTGVSEGEVIITAVSAANPSASGSAVIIVEEEESDYWYATEFEDAEIDILEEFSSLEYIGYLDEDMGANWFAYTPDVEDIGTLVDILFECDGPDVKIELFLYSPSLSPPLTLLHEDFEFLEFQVIMTGQIHYIKISGDVDDMEMFYLEIEEVGSDDYDDDDLTNFQEVYIYKTDPYEEDTASVLDDCEAGLSDGDKVELGLHDMDKYYRMRNHPNYLLHALPEDWEEWPIWDTDRLLCEDSFEDSIFEGNDAEPEITVKVRGRAKSEMFIAESRDPFLAAITPIVGKPLDIYKSDRVKSGTIKFTMKENLHTTHNKFMIFRYTFGDMELTPLPTKAAIVTKSGVTASVFSASLNGRGTYFVLNIEEYMQYISIDFNDFSQYFFSVDGDGNLIDGEDYYLENATVTAVAAGGRHTAAITEGGTLWAWGDNTRGQLGSGSSINSTRPAQIGGAAGWSSVSAGYAHTAALKTDGSLWAWGRNDSGQLGDGSLTDQNAPVRIGTDSNWASISAGSYHTMAIKTDGSLWAWGWNQFGQLGDGTMIKRPEPVRIGTAADWAGVSAGVLYTTAVKTDGSLWAWGYNYYGQLGGGSRIDQSSPAQIGTATDWASAAAGKFHTTAIKTGGTLWVWGRSHHDTSLSLSSPYKMYDDTDWASAAEGDSQTMALKTDGTLWTWGSRSPLSQVGTDSDWASVTASEDRILALKTDGSLWAWCDDFTLVQVQIPLPAQTGHHPLSQAITTMFYPPDSSIPSPFAISSPAAETDIIIAVHSSGSIPPARQDNIAAQVGEILSRLDNANISLVQISGNLNSALIDLYAAFAPNLSKHLLLITDTDYRKNLNSTLDDAVEIAYNNNIALSVASPMPNRYSKFYYIERTGGVSVNYKGSFADEFCEVVENPTGRVEEGATIILKGGKTAELVQYPNFTDTVTDSDGDGLADTEELLKGTAWIDFTLPYELYTGQRLPAGVRALIPVFGYTSDPSEYSTNGSGIADIDVNPVSLRVALYGNARRGDIDEGDDTDEVLAEVVVFVPSGSIGRFGFRYQRDRETIDFGKVKKNNFPIGFATLYNSDTNKIGEKVFVYEPFKATDFNTFMGQVVSKVGVNVKIDFITERSGVTDVQAYHNTFAGHGRIGRVFALDRRQKTTPEFYQRYRILPQNQGEQNPDTKYHIFPARANRNHLSYEQMQALVLNLDNDSPEITPWELSLHHDEFNGKKRLLKLSELEITEITIVTYPWFARADAVEATPRKENVVEITNTGSKITGSPLTTNNNGKKKNANTTIIYTIEGKTIPRRVSVKITVVPNTVNIYQYAEAMGGTASAVANSKTKVKITYNGVQKEFAVKKNRICPSEVNTVMGWDYSWIPNGQTHAVYIGIHAAFVQKSFNPFNHASIIVFAAPSSTFAANEFFEKATSYPRNNSYYMTFGGESSNNPFDNEDAGWGHVISKNNRTSDVRLYNKKEMIPLRSVDETKINNLLARESTFRGKQATSNLTYFPTGSGNTYNSNSFAHGLLIASGINNISHPILNSHPILSNIRTPGWGRPIPSQHFQ
jgi:hypothetical protein